jgi:hypothetical protein
MPRQSLWPFSFVYTLRRLSRSFPSELGWFKRLQFSPSKTLAFIPRIRRGRAGQFPTASEPPPLQIYLEQMTLPRKLDSFNTDPLGKISRYGARL